MGRAKAWLPFAGEFMLPRVVRLLCEVVEPVLVVAAPGQEVPPLPGDVAIVRDEQEDRGPLQGLAAGLAALAGKADAAYLSSCDVPFLQPAFVGRIIDLLGDHAICVPRSAHHHPLAAVYRLDVLAAVHHLLGENRLRPFFLFEAVKTRRRQRGRGARRGPDLPDAAQPEHAGGVRGGVRRLGATKHHRLFLWMKRARRRLESTAYRIATRRTRRFFPQGVSHVAHAASAAGPVGSPGPDCPGAGAECRQGRTRRALQRQGPHRLEGQGLAQEQMDHRQGVLDEKNPSRLAITEGPSGDLINPDHAGDLYTEQKFGDGTFEVEFMIPKGSNSGVYLMGEYEIQILDSFGKAKVGPGDMGGLYSIAAPKVNACKKPGRVAKVAPLEYQVPCFDEAGKKTANFKLVKALLNDEVIHENVEAKALTGRRPDREGSGDRAPQCSGRPRTCRRPHRARFTPAAKK